MVPEVGRRIRELRQKKGWSQEALAEEAGLHRTYIGQVERGEKSIRMKDLVRLAGALRVRPFVLLDTPREANNGGRTAQSQGDLSGLVDEYRALLRGLQPCRRESVEAVLTREADWTPEAAQHLVRLACDYGSFVLRNATAVSLVLEIEDGKLGF